MDIIIITSEVMAPGLLLLTALVTWNTSTTPSILHCSRAMLAEQYTPVRLTVSLQYQYIY